MSEIQKLQQIFGNEFLDMLFLVKLRKDMTNIKFKNKTQKLIEFFCENLKNLLSVPRKTPQILID